MIPEMEGFVSWAEIEDVAKRIVWPGKSLKDPYLAVVALTVGNFSMSIDHWRLLRSPRVALYYMCRYQRRWTLSSRYEYVVGREEVAANTAPDDLGVFVKVFGWRNLDTDTLSIKGTIGKLRKHLDGMLPKPQAAKPQQGALFDLSLGDPEA